WFTSVFEKQPQSDASPGASGNADAPRAISARAHPLPGRANRPARILLAEDNSTNQAVANGVAALKALREADYDLILMDCGMPEMDGCAATKCIREGQAGARSLHIPIVALTADAMNGDRDKCLAAGMSDYLAKPVELQNLAGALERCLITPLSDSELSYS